MSTLPRPVRCLVALVTIKLTLLFGAAVRADITIDDFEVPAELVLDYPYLSNIGPDYQFDIGDLSARRSMFLDGIDTAMDSSVTQPSHLSLDNYSFTQTASSNASFHVDYRFGEHADLTIDGNDGFLVDVDSVTGTKEPTFIRIIVADKRTHYESYAKLPISSNPYSVEFPFDDFRGLGGAPVTPDFENIVFVTMDVIHIVPQDTFTFHAAIDRIRVGQIVPEPSIYWVLLAVVMPYARCVGTSMCRGRIV